MEKSELKRRYKQDHKEVQKIVNDFDPCDLISAGAPSDEYDCLTDQILSFIHQNKNNNQIRELVLHELELHFGTPDIPSLKEPFKSLFESELSKFLTKLENYRQHRL